MDCGKVGRLILSLRKEKGLTQRQLASAMNISDRTISKWERGAGCPDISLLTELSEILNVNIEKILSGEEDTGKTDGGSMKKIKFYVCPVCQNALFDTGDAEISCCGRKLSPQALQEGALGHEITAEEVEDDLYITLNHDMTKEHYILFAAYVLYDRVLFVKLYPEQAAEVRFPRMQPGDIYFYCTRHGLIKKGRETRKIKEKSRGFLPNT